MSRSETVSRETARANIARTSVVAAGLLAILKGAAGLASGSLALMAEAVHSLFDSLMSAMAWVSLRYAGRPPDATHHYGHGKIESLAALAETALLFAISLGIAWEGARRLLFHGERHIEVTVVAFLVMMISVAVDIYRWRRSRRAAAEFRSQTLEAEALHFASDILTSLIVIAGLAGVKLGFPRADAIAALLVSLWVLGMCGRLGWDSVRALLDTAPVQAREAVLRAVEGMSGIERVTSVRVRQSGSRTFADLVLQVDQRMSVAEAHCLADQAEAAVANVLPEADVLIHAEPGGGAPGGSRNGAPAREAFSAVAREMDLQFHHITIFESEKGKIAMVDLEFPPALPLRQARARADAFAREVVRRVEGLEEVGAHIDIDYSGDDQVAGRALAVEEAPSPEEVAREARAVPQVVGCHAIVFTEFRPSPAAAEEEESGGYLLSIHVTVQADVTVAQSHQIALEVERRLCRRFPQIRKVHIHQEAHGG